MPVDETEVKQKYCGAAEKWRRAARLLDASRLRGRLVMRASVLECVQPSGAFNPHLRAASVPPVKSPVAKTRDSSRSCQVYGLSLIVRVVKG